MSEPGKCPECKTDLTVCEVGPYCANPECPVCDDADLWDGNRNRRPGPMDGVLFGELFESVREAGDMRARHALDEAAPGQRWLCDFR